MEDELFDSTAIDTMALNMLEKVHPRRRDRVHALLTKAFADKANGTSNPTQKAVFTAMGPALAAAKAALQSPLFSNMRKWADDGDDPFGVTDFTDAPVAQPKNFDTSGGKPGSVPTDPGEFFTESELRACGLPTDGGLKVPRRTEKRPLDRLTRG